MMEGEKTTVEKYREDLTAHLLATCTDAGLLKGKLLSSSDMDDHITDTILKDRRHSVPSMQSCAANAYHFLMRESPEPGTAEAYRLFLATVETMFRIGAAIELCRAGYKFEKVNLT